MTSRMENLLRDTFYFSYYKNCPFVQWQDSGLWSRESKFESLRGNALTLTIMRITDKDIGKTVFTRSVHTDGSKGKWENEHAIISAIAVTGRIIVRCGGMKFNFDEEDVRIFEPRPCTK